MSPQRWFTERVPTGFLRRCVAVLCVLVLVLASVSCGVPVESSADPLPAGDIPDGLRPVGPADTTPAIEQEVASIWFVRDEQLASTQHRVPSPATPEGVVAEVLAGPTESEQDRSLRSAIPDPAAVVGVSLVRGTAVVSLTSAFAEIPAGDQVLAVAQLVLTLTDLRGVGRVRFTVDDVQIAVPLPSGEVTDESVSRDDYLDLTRPVADRERPET